MEGVVKLFQDIDKTGRGSTVFLWILVFVQTRFLSNERFRIRPEERLKGETVLTEQYLSNMFSKHVHCWRDQYRPPYFKLASIFWQKIWP